MGLTVIAGARPRRAISAPIVIGKQLQLRLIGELFQLADAHDAERDPAERRTIEAKFDALLALVNSQKEGARHGR
jgi:hypothetical protein